MSVVRGLEIAAALVAGDDQIYLPASDGDKETKGTRSYRRDRLRFADLPRGAGRNAAHTHDALACVAMAASFDIINLNVSGHGWMGFGWRDRRDSAVCA